MNFNIYLPTKNFPFLINDTHRPHWKNDDEKLDFIARYYPAFDLVNLKGQPTFTNYFSMNINISVKECLKQDPYVNWTRDRFKQVANLIVTEFSVKERMRFYFVTEIVDKGEDILSYNCSLDVWSTFWEGKLIDSSKSCQVLRKHLNRVVSVTPPPALISKYYFNYRSEIANGDPTITKYQGGIIQKEAQYFSSKNIVAEGSFTKNELLRVTVGHIPDPNNPNKTIPVYGYYYALLTMTNLSPRSTEDQYNFLPNQFKSFGDTRAFDMQPLFIAPISSGVTPLDNLPLLKVNTYANTLLLGGSYVLSIFYSPVPLIQDSIWESPEPPRPHTWTTLGENYTLPSQLADFKDYMIWPFHSLGVLNIPYSDSEIGDVEYKTPLTFIFDPNQYSSLTKDSLFNPDWEPLIHCAPFTNITVTAGTGTTALDYLFLAQNYDSDITLRSRQIITPHGNKTVYFINSGVYQNDWTARFFDEGTNNLPCVSNNYINFLINNSNTFNTGKANLTNKYNIESSNAMSNTFLGAVGGAMIFSLSKLVSSVGGVWAMGGLAAYQMISSFIKGEFQQQALKIDYNNQNAAMDATVHDLQNQGQDVRGIGLNDYLDTRTLVKKLYNSTGYPYITVKELISSQKETVGLHFHRFGYIINQTMSLRWDDFRTRYDFDYVQINNFADIIYKGDYANEVVQWFNNFLKNGATLWHVDEGKFLDYSRINLERNI